MNRFDFVTAVVEAGGKRADALELNRRLESWGERLPECNRQQARLIIAGCYEADVIEADDLRRLGQWIPAATPELVPVFEVMHSKGRPLLPECFLQLIEARP